MSAYLDTHVALWLYAGETERISKRAATLINRESMLASPIVLLELEYLREVGRVAATPQTVIAELKRRVGLAIQGPALDRDSHPPPQPAHSSLRRRGATHPPPDRPEAALAPPCTP